MKILRVFDSLKFMLATVACVFILNVANAATLPAGYTELEYIHFVNGVGNIKTGIIPTSSIEIEVKASFSSGYALAYNTGLSASSTKGVYWQGSTGWGMDGHSVSYAVANGSIQTVIQNRNNVIVNGRQYNYISAVDDFVGINELFIGGINTNKFSGNIYSFIVRFNGVMKRNFVPARRDIDGVLGMYDTVYMEFYTNQGSGSFTAGPDVIPQIKIATTRYNEEQFEPVQNRLSDAMDAVDTVVTQTMTQAQAIDTIATSKQTRPNEGCDAKYCLLVEDEQGVPHWYPIAGANGVAHNLPDGYTELQYIESTGTQYINTNITGSTNAIIDMQGTPRTDDMVVFMLAPIGATAYQNGFGQYKSAIASDFDVATRRVYNVSYTSSSLTVNGVNVSSRYIANNVNLALFGSTATNRRIRGAKLYSAKIYNNDTLLRNFIPAKNSNNEIGLYDMVSGQFFTNQGTGVFGEGPVVE